VFEVRRLVRGAVLRLGGSDGALSRCCSHGFEQNVDTHAACRIVARWFMELC
jgi:hypothetical protein